MERKRDVGKMCCWHCADTNACSCITCGAEGAGGWKPGPCVPCKGRKRWDRLRTILERKNINPAEARWWRTDRAGTGHFQRIFMPEEEFNMILKTRDEQ